MITLFSHPESPYCHRVQITLTELELNERTKLVDLSRNKLTTKESRQALQFGKVPALRWDTHTLQESLAIMRFACAMSHKQLLYPLDISARSKVDMWIDFSHNHIGVPSTQLRWQLFWGPQRGLETSQDVAMRCREQILKNMPALEHQLRDNQYIAGKSFSLADIALIPQICCLTHSDIDLTEFEATRNWMENMLDRRSCSFLKDLKFSN